MKWSDGECENSIKAGEMVAMGAQACFSGYLYVGICRPRICLLYVAVVTKRWRVAATITGKRLTYGALGSLRWDSIRLP